MNHEVAPSFTNRSDFKIAGLKIRSGNKEGELRALWQQFSDRFEELKPLAVSGAAYGAIDNFDEGEGVFDYLAGVEVASTEGLPEGVEVWELLAQNYAVFHTTLATLMETIDRIYGTWMPQSNYRRAPGPEFEYYDDAFDPEDDSSPFKLYIPIEPLAGGE